MVLVTGNLWLAVLTRYVDDAETRDDVDVSINIDGTDIVSSLLDGAFCLIIRYTGAEGHSSWCPMGWSNQSPLIQFP